MGRKVRDLTKEGPFGRLTAVKSLGRKYGRNTYFLCLCECGGTVEARGPHLLRGSVKSCGCLPKETCAATGSKTGGWNRTHGASGTGTFNTWKSMIERCDRPEHSSYAMYGGRGIKVCPEWREFGHFLADMGDRPDGTSLDRIDFNGDYEPDNCRWATNREQALNTRRNVHLELNGRTQTIIEWAEEIGLSPKTIWSRLHVLGWTVERALTESSHRKKEVVDGAVSF